MRQKPLCRGGGGAWRAFFHHKMRGNKFSGAMAKELSEQYRGLTPEQKAWYEDVGRFATAAHKCGQRSLGQKGPSSCGPRDAPNGMDGRVMSAIAPTAQGQHESIAERTRLKAAVDKRESKVVVELLEFDKANCGSINLDASFSECLTDFQQYLREVPGNASTLIFHVPA